MDSNDKTLQSYNAHIQDYVAATPQTVEGKFKQWLDKLLKLIPKSATILELGSGFGRDAKYIESQGYKVFRTDASNGFVALLKEQGYNAQQLNVLTDDLGSNRDMIFAHAVFLHFDPGQTGLVLRKAYQSLKHGGVLAFSVKKGSGGKWTQEKLNAPRYFYYWESSPLQKVVTEAGFKIIDFSERTGAHDEWLQIIAKK